MEEHLNPSEAARRLGISIKALRLYEQRGLIAPLRRDSGWRVYSPDTMARAAEIVALRALGFSLGQIGRVLHGDCDALEPVLAAHQSTLEEQLDALAAATEKVRALRAALAQGETPAISEIVALATSPRASAVSLTLPWPWNGEQFELPEIRAITHITGPLFSGKTRLAQCLAASIPQAVFVGLDRLDDGGAAARSTYDSDPALQARVDSALDWLIGDGAAHSRALLALLVALESNEGSICVVDMLEQGLDEPTQKALIEFLRRRGREARPLLFLTRSTAILDLERSAMTRRSFTVRQTTACRWSSHPCPAPRDTISSPHAWHRPRCARARMASSPCARPRRDARARHPHTHASRLSSSSRHDTYSWV